MPDATCNKCQKTLGQVCTTDKIIDNLRELVDARATKLLGNIVSISPGIQHNEINKDCECDGVFWVDILAPTPNNVEWGS